MLVLVHSFFDLCTYTMGYVFIMCVHLEFCIGPTTSPQNFVAVLVTSDSFTLSWTLLPGLEPGGLQIGYVINCDPGIHRVMVNLSGHAYIVYSYICTYSVHKI